MGELLSVRHGWLLPSTFMTQICRLSVTLEAKAMRPPPGGMVGLGVGEGMTVGLGLGVGVGVGVTVGVGLGVGVGVDVTVGVWLGLGVALAVAGTMATALVGVGLSPSSLPRDHHRATPRNATSSAPRRIYRTRGSRRDGLGGGVGRGGGCGWAADP